MKAILMAAGYGTRISRNVSKPKSVLEIGNTTIIRNSVEMLLRHNIEVAVVVGYKRGEVRSTLKGLKVQYFQNPFYKVTNSLASLWFAKDFFDKEDDIILANADVYWEDDLLESLLKNSNEIVMLGDKKRIKEGDFFFTVENEQVVKYGKKMPLEERSCEYVGIAKLDKNVLKKGFLKRMEKLIWKEAYHLWWENVLYEYCDKFPIYIQDVEEHFWGEVDYIEDYERILAYINQKNKV